MTSTPDVLGKLQLLAGGRLVSPSGSFPVEDPGRGEPCAHCPEASLELLEAAIASAKAAGPGWARSQEDRRRALEQFGAALKANAETLAHILCVETGIPFRDAQGEVMMAAAFPRYRAGAPLPAETLHDDGKQHVEVVRTPVGVVGAVIPWNAPLLIACEKIATAFAAGDCVVVKPSPLAPLTTVVLAMLLADVLPPGVLSIVPGSDELGAALVAHPEVAMISFTGSIETGRAIMAAAAPGLKRLSLELGGNDAAIVLPDADVERQAPKLFQGAFYRSGQLCAAIKRLYVPEELYERAVAALGKVAAATVVGDPFDEGVTMGPVSNRPQFERVRGLVGDAVAAGGNAVAGGEPLDRPGYFYPPTLVTDVGPDVALVAEEQFGPALPVIPYRDVDAAVAAANATPFGLGGSVWAADVGAAVEVARRLECGSAWVNRHGVLSPEVPFGGMKQSGVGRANGTVGLDAYCELQTISVALPRPA
jgi:acyl-CoA reductase-like NAD-dependent aldehyde dehydrogenase